MELNTKEGLKLLSAEIKNFQGISHKLIQLDGKSVVIVGKNNGKKSSYLRAIGSPIGANIVPAKPIKEGEVSASVELTIGGVLNGEERSYTFDMYFDEENQKGRMVVKDEGGTAVTSKGSREDIIGRIGFDIDQFIRLGMTERTGKVSKAGVKEQVELLMEFMTLEERKSIFELDKRSKEIYDERTDINKEIKTKEAFIKNNTLSQEEIDLYRADKYQEAKDIQTKMQNIANEVIEYSKREDGVASRKEKIEANDKFLIDFEAASAFFEGVKLLSGTDKSFTNPELTNSLLGVHHTFSTYVGNCNIKIEENKKLQSEVDQVQAWLDKNQKPSVEELSNQLEVINTHNKKHEEIKAYTEAIDEIQLKKNESENKTKELSAIASKKAKIFAESKMPVKGLEFDEDQVLFNGLPFNEDHHPTSTIIAVGIKIAMAMNPNLRMIFIKDGSMFDKETFSGVLNMVEKQGYQLLIEMVDWNANDTEIKFTEEFINEK